jgi:V-type H+-transporting ATPase subunit a
VGVTAQADEMSQLTLDFELEDLPDILSKTVSGLDEAISSYDAIAKQVRQFAECRTVVDVCSKYLEGPSRLSGDSDAKQLSEHPSTDTASMIPGSPVASEYIDQRTLERRLSQPLLENERMSSGFRMLSRICGCILTSRRVVMERMLFRATRGNLLSRFIELSDELEDPETGEKVKKVVFILFYSGERIKERTLKILSALNATVYEIPEGKGSQNQMLSDLSRNIEQQADICTRSKDLRDQILADIASSVKRWKYLVFKERITYNEMNKFDTKMSASLIAECWIPAHSFEVLREMLDKLTSYGSDSQALLQELFPPPPSAGDIPTFIETNKFTSVFQGVVDSFGTPDYREFNPGLFTIITFPFLFGIMFGDVGHGSIMTAAAAAFIYYEKRLASSKMNEMVQMMYDGRYIIFLMGLFSVYCGFIYNETFAVPLPWFGHSKWTGVSSEQKTAVLTGVYPFGADPVWAESDAGLPFFNSLKMKMAIIIGVSQMVVGIFLNLLNSVYFRRPLDIIFGFIPQIIFSRFLSVFRSY